MKILIVNASDTEGGAARAAYRLHKALLHEGAESKMLVQVKMSDDYSVIGPRTKFKKILGKLRPVLDSLPFRPYTRHSKTLYSSNWLPCSSMVNEINEINPDIVHIHWVNGGMLRIEDLKKIKAPIVWSLHDMWPFTDGYHYDPRFDVKKNGIKEDYKLLKWLKNSKRKNKTYQRINKMTIVGLSKWIFECSKKSDLLGKKFHVNLPNPIDTKIFRPLEQGVARDLLNLPRNKKLILFGAMGATSDGRKGFNELFRCLHFLCSDYELVVFGASEPENSQGFKQKIHYRGKLHDDVTLRAIYSAADVMVVPSLQENLSNVIMESLACGTPVVGFDIGGNSDLIINHRTGCLAKPFDSEDLAKNIEWVLSQDDPMQLREAARQKVLQDFDARVVAKKYIQLYKNLLAG